MLRVLSKLIVQHKQDRSRRISWSDTIDTVKYEQEDYTVKNLRKPQRKDYLDHTHPTRKRFRTASEAIETSRKKAKEELYKHYHSNILPHLACFHMSHLSPEILESMQVALIDELDSHRQLNPNTDQYYKTQRYVVLEQKLLVLLEALNYVSQRNDMYGQLGDETASQLQTRNDDRSDSQSDPECRACFPVKFWKRLVQTPERIALSRFPRGNSLEKVATTICLSCTKADGHVVCT